MSHSPLYQEASQNALCRSHETRLQRLEDGISDCNAALVETRMDIKHLKESVHETLGTLEGKVDKVLECVADLKPRVEKVEVVTLSAVAKKAWIRSTVIGLVLTGLGAAIAKLFERLV